MKKLLSIALMLCLTTSLRAQTVSRDSIVYQPLANHHEAAVMIIKPREIAEAIDTVALKKYKKIQKIMLISYGLIFIIVNVVSLKSDN